MSIRLKRTSRLRFTDLIVADDVEFFDLVDLPKIEERAEDLTHRVTSFDRIDSIAVRYYGDPVLWWVIAQANNMRLLPSDLKVGSEIRIPAPDWVRTQLFQKAKVR